MQWTGAVTTGFKSSNNCDYCVAGWYDSDGAAGGNATTCAQCPTNSDSATGDAGCTCTTGFAHSSGRSCTGGDCASTTCSACSNSLVACEECSRLSVCTLCTSQGTNYYLSGGTCNTIQNCTTSEYETQSPTGFRNRECSDCICHEDSRTLDSMCDSYCTTNKGFGGSHTIGYTCGSGKYVTNTNTANA